MQRNGARVDGLNQMDHLIEMLAQTAAPLGWVIDPALGKDLRYVSA
jgi:hypothetical protein